MANQLDEINGPVMDGGRDVNVINKPIEIKTGAGSIFFEVMLWILFIIPGIIFQFKKTAAKNRLAQLEQKIQHNASQIDNFLEQRVIILTNAASILDKSINLDKGVMETIAAYRSGINLNNESKPEMWSSVDSALRSINVQFENYPNLEAHGELRDVLQQNSYLQKEITAARELYNDTVFQWNREVNEWPTKMIVASRLHYTTRIPFATSKEVKQQARTNFFK
ncbi:MULTISPECIES: LemA family protein [unclassified Mycoplasma]|uniref:LemA family protein n=1 Tax=unclassified Mycoplasma TaxID=2683645 RepID=UPI00216AE0D5|nr:MULTISPECIES: LemA family protein [unclassified Mycoplasma]MCS4537033.1 LemA family protein [Mycoplasma sp. CSL7475-4]MCT4469404.1 LemA family protein [Mycoplasma sp. HS2188]